MHQKNAREQENERQWKQLQAQRARDQQMQQMQHAGLHDKMQGTYQVIVLSNFSNWLLI